MPTEAEFRQTLAAEGYGEAEEKTYPANVDGEMHAHDVSVMLLVLDGEFRLAEEDGVTVFEPGAICRVQAGVRHVEQSGPDGARVLLARK